mmetsp:Transcript_53914/g.161328  ORF Transcript_53914/g.161328 Transcript_53914/m.161328 type:complete len:348 (-) Transcript_53914:2949-3992(-)
MSRGGRRHRSVRSGTRRQCRRRCTPRPPRHHPGPSPPRGSWPPPPWRVQSPRGRDRPARDSPPFRAPTFPTSTHPPRRVSPIRTSSTNLDPSDTWPSWPSSLPRTLYSRVLLRSRHPTPRPETPNRSPNSTDKSRTRIGVPVRRATLPSRRGGPLRGNDDGGREDRGRCIPCSPPRRRFPRSRRYGPSTTRGACGASDERQCRCRRERPRRCEGVSSRAGRRQSRGWDDPRGGDGAIGWPVSSIPSSHGCDAPRPRQTSIREADRRRHRRRRYGRGVPIGPREYGPWPDAAWYDEIRRGRTLRRHRRGVRRPIGRRGRRRPLRLRRCPRRRHPLRRPPPPALGPPRS